MRSATTSPQNRRHRITAFAVGLTLYAFAIELPMSQAQEPSAGFQMGNKAGAYLGAIEYVRTFKLSKCGYALKRSFPPPKELIAMELTPAFPVQHRPEAQSMLTKMLPDLERQAKAEVATMIAGAQKQSGEKTGCGVVAGMLAATGARTKDEWETVSKASGVKGR